MDLGTSGIVVIAKNKDSASALQKSLEESKKHYYALVMKNLPGDSGVWSMPISSKAEGRKNIAGQKSLRKKSITNWKVINRHPLSTELDIRIETGRKHQIRKHCALSKHPIVGDTRYGNPKTKFSRIALHCYRLKIKERSTEITIDCPLNSEFSEFL